ncbi:MAG: Brp/Blh family beta-carotene 15,15'-dioxygenase [Bacteroidota bacterium]
MSLVRKSILAALTLAVAGMALSGIWEAAIAFFLIVVFGIPHGATDHAVFNFLTRREAKSVPQIRFLVSYLGTIAGYALLWYWLPGWSFLLFLAVSAFHFGETQMVRYRIENGGKWLAYAGWGTVVLLLIFWPNQAEVHDFIVPYLVGETAFTWVVEQAAWLLTLAGVMWLVPMIVAGNGRGILREFAELALIALIGWGASLLLSFAVFFAFWHSRDAVWLQIERIRSGQRNFSLGQWVRLALPYTLVSLVGIGAIVLLYGQFTAAIPLVTFFFILVALITLPHVFVMSVFYHRVEAAETASLQEHM